MMKHTIKLFLIIVLVSTFGTTLNAQKKTFSDISEVYLKSSGEIKKDDIIAGYYFMYKIDRLGFNEVLYELVLLDQNLNQYATRKFEGPVGLHLLKILFNGDSFFIKFYEETSSLFTYTHFNKNLEEINKYTENVTGFVEKNAASLQFMTGSPYYTGPLIYSASNKGFINISTIKQKKIGYRITFYPENLEENKWIYTSNSTSKKYEVVKFLNYSEKMILFRTTINRSENNLLAINPKTGEKIFEISLEDEDYKYEINNSFINNSNEVVLVGLFHGKKKYNHLGICALSINEEGKYIEKKRISWDEDIPEINFAKDKHIHFHKIFQNKENVFLISERSQFIKGSRYLGDFVLFKFDNQFVFENLKIIDKEESVDKYNYSFTQMSNDKKSFSVGFQDFVREKKELKRKHRWFFKAVNYSNGEFTTDEINLASEATSRKIYQGKPSHIMIYEYFKKEKRVDVRLEQINF